MQDSRRGEELVGQFRHARPLEVSCPTKYFPEASSIDFKRSLIYGIRKVRQQQPKPSEMLTRRGAHITPARQSKQVIIRDYSDIHHHRIVKQGANDEAINKGCFGSWFVASEH
jgi:hypothetical protein